MVGLWSLNNPCGTKEVNNILFIVRQSQQEYKSEQQDKQSKVEFNHLSKQQKIGTLSNNANTNCMIWGFCKTTMH